MPLSEHEQRVIETLERSLYAQNHDLVHRVRSEITVLNARRRVTLSVLGVLAGLSLVIALCWTTTVAVGVGGSLIMFASSTSSWRTQAGGAGRDRTASVLRGGSWDSLRICSTGCVTCSVFAAERQLLLEDQYHSWSTEHRHRCVPSPTCRCSCRVANHSEPELDTRTE